MKSKIIFSFLLALAIPSLLFAGYSSVDTLRLADQGSASAPSLTRKGDTDTGLYFSAANTLDFTAGGSRVLTFSSSGLTNLSAISLLGTATQVTIAYDGSNSITMAVGSAGELTTTSTDGTVIKSQTISLADDAGITLNAGTGVVEVFVEGQDEFAIVHIQDDGTVATASVELGDVALTDADAKLCIYDSGSAARIKNRLGATRVITYIHKRK